MSWSLALLLSSDRSLSFAGTAIADSRTSAANRIVLEQHGAASEGRGGDVHTASSADARGFNNRDNKDWLVNPLPVNGGVELSEVGESSIGQRLLGER